MSKRNATKNALPGSILTIGLDIGYGVVKAVTSDQVVMFPSVTGHAREIKFQQEDMAQADAGEISAPGRGRARDFWATGRAQPRT